MHIALYDLPMMSLSLMGFGKLVRFKPGFVDEGNGFEEKTAQTQVLEPSIRPFGLSEALGIHKDHHGPNVVYSVYAYLEPPCPQKSREVTRKSGFETWQVEKPGFCSENRVLTPGPHFPRFSTLSIMFDKISTLTQSEHLPLFLGASISHK